MTEAVNSFLELMEARSDKRVSGWFMMSSLWPSVTICLLYTWFVVQSGPRLMAKRSPFDLRKFMIFYNFSLVLLSGHCCYEFLMAGWLRGYSFRCQRNIPTLDYLPMRMANVCWVFYISKFVELMDTVIFVLRKKNSQITALHVFHHAVMPVSWWVVVKFTPGGAVTFHALLNSFIHFLMYIYYGVAGLGPHYRKYLWWKKYMTSMQIIQFMLVMIHCTWTLVDPSCDIPAWHILWVQSYALLFFFLFLHFYVKTYKARSVKREINSNEITHQD